MKSLSIAFCVSCCTGALLFGTLAAAQDSPEYRRGYKQGFDDGYRKAQSEQRPGRGGRISITNATYGPDGSRGRCDATVSVRRQADGQRSASIEVNNEMCGDPSPGKRKSVLINYRCANVAKTASGYEGSPVYLSCD